MSERSAKALGRRALKVAERVEDVRDVELGALGHDLVRSAPERLHRLHELSLLGVQLVELHAPHTLPRARR